MERSGAPSTLQRSEGQDRPVPCERLQRPQRIAGQRVQRSPGAGTRGLHRQPRVGPTPAAQAGVAQGAPIPVPYRVSRPRVSRPRVSRRRRPIGHPHNGHRRNGHRPRCPRPRCPRPRCPRTRGPSPARAGHRLRMSPRTPRASRRRGRGGQPVPSGGAVQPPSSNEPAQPVQQVPANWPPPQSRAPPPTTARVTIATTGAVGSRWADEDWDQACAIRLGDQDWELPAR